MGATTDYPEPCRGNEGPRHLCHRYLIKAQAAASAGLTGLSLDLAMKRALDYPSQRQGKRGACERHLLCICTVVLIYLNLR